MRAETAETRRKDREVGLGAALLARSFDVSNDSERDRLNKLSYTVIGLAIEVHTSLGPGLRESSYEECLFVELTGAGLRVDRQKTLPLVYKGHRVPRGYRIDFVIENVLVVEVKSVNALAPVHRAQLRAHLIQANLKLGLLINFNVKRLRDGVQRVVNGFPD